MRNEMEHLCVLCGSSNPELTYSSFKPSSNFTSFDLLGAGDSLCAECEKFFKDQNYRRKSWVWSCGKTQFLNAKKEIMAYLLEPPQCPFMIHISSAGKRQTFLRLFRNGANLSRNSFWISEEDLGLVHVNLEKLKELYSFAQTAYLAVGKKKLPLLEGAPVKAWIQRDICERIETVKGDPLWKILVKAL